jgi:hypothetical protein
MNNRERDALGRPLPPGATGLPGPTSRADRTSDETLTEAQRWLDDGRPFAAHEIFEDAWKSCPPTERRLWQGLAQAAVALTHALRGNPTGALAVLGRAREHLAPFETNPPYGIDIAALLAWADRIQASLQDATAGDFPIVPGVPPLRRG